MLNFAIIIIAIIGTSFIVDVLLSNSIGKGYRIFVAPGVIVHELSHAFACFLTGAKVTNISMFKKDGGEVSHGKPKIPIIGQILISIAPFVVGAVIIYFLSRLIGVKQVDFSQFSLSVRDISLWIEATFQGLDVKSYLSWIVLYLIISIAVTMTPSTRDLLNMLISLFIIFLIIFLVIKYTNFRPDLSFLITDQFLLVLSTILILLLFGLLLSIIIFIFSRVFRNN